MDVDYVIPAPPPPPPHLPPRTGVRSYTAKCRQKEMQFQLVGVIEGKDEVELHNLIQNGVNINTIIMLAKTPLTHAIDLGHSSVASILIDHGANVMQPEDSPLERQPVHYAALRDLVGVFEKLKDYGAHLDYADTSSMTPLHIACYAGSYDAVKWLVKNGVHSDAADNVNWTPLHRAVEGNHIEIVKLLLDAGANIDNHDKYDWTPLFHCVWFDRIDMVKLLLTHGSAVNSSSYSKDTPIHIACARFRRPVVLALLSTSADPVYRRVRMPSAQMEEEISRRACHGHCRNDVIELLINHGADVNVRNNLGETPLYLALFHVGDANLVRYLVSAGSDLSREYLIHVDAETQFDERILRILNMLPWLKDQAQLQKSLKDICRIKIRRCLGWLIDEKCELLPLPRAMQHYLILDQISEH